MNKLVRQLLSSGSLAALQLCAFGGTAARAAGTTISGAHTDVNVTSPVDFIHITNTPTLITGNVTNKTTVGNGANPYGILVDGGLTIRGALINAASGVINATRTGIYVDAAAGVVNVNNAGKIQVTGPTAPGSHEDYGAGIIFNHNPASAITLTNTGTVGVSIQNARSTTNSGSFRATAVGIEAGANNSGGGSPSNTLTNSGNVVLLATQRVNNTDGVNANARAYAESALHQSGYGPNVIVAGSTNTLALTNSAILSLNAHATATATNGNAYANAYGEAIGQTGGGAADIEFSITNTGNIGINSLARASSTNDYADADASGNGINQFAYDYSTGNATKTRKANLTITNSGNFSILGQAAAIGSDGAEATADVSFMRQIAENVGKTVESITNTGRVTLRAIANVTASEASVTAKAHVHQVFYQNASENNPLLADRNISQTITNSARLDLTATAKVISHSVTDNGSAKASALVEDVFQQRASGAAVTAQKITNSGALNIAAGATATGQQLPVEYRGRVTANAYIGNVFLQNATGYSSASAHVNNTITQAITNSGGLSLSAVAHANGSVGEGYSRDQVILASAQVGGIFDQQAGNGVSASQTITNTSSGTIALTATAVAHLAAATTFTPFNNSMEARAFVGNVFEQDVGGVKTITQSITNSAIIIAGAGATASALSTTAGQASKMHVYAVAAAGHVFGQYVSGANILGGSANQAITNSGAITLAAAAKAVGEWVTGGGQSGHARSHSAKAHVSGVFSQNASNIQSITQAITNSATLTLRASATVTGLGTHDKVSALAVAGNIFHQVGANSDNGPISQAITNSGALNLTINSKAAGQYQSTCCTVGAAANAEVNHIFSQVAIAGVASQTITNSGVITIIENATANATNADTIPVVGYRDRAFAGLNGIAIQVANGEGDNGTTSTQNFTDTAAVTATLTATAKTAFNPSAVASIQNLVKQSAESNRGAANQNISISNTGSFTITANATAVAPSQVNTDAEAFALVDDEPLFYQLARCDQGAVTQIFSNAGIIKLLPTAVASSAADASAYAEVSSPVIAQRAEEGGAPLAQTLTNSGAVTLTLTGTAKVKDQDASAGASINGPVFVQSAEEAGKPVVQTLTNSGSLTISNVAAATATKYEAEATAKIGATVLKQHASQENGGTVTQNLTNSGTVGITLTANAKGKTDAFASARVHTSDTDGNLVRQISDGPTNLNQTFTNSGSFTLTENATAKVPAPGVSHENVTALAGFDYLVRQTAEDAFVTTFAGIHDTQSITNSGSITVVGHATATGIYGVTARAAGQRSVLAQKQFEGGSAASQSMTNSGTIAITLVGTATTKSTTDQANAQGMLDGVMSQFVGQSNELGQSASLTMVNSGSINLLIAGTATGAAYVRASAKVDDVFRQSADADNTATLSITNSGTINVTANALAKKGTGADAEAEARLASQHVGGEAMATLSFTNSKSATLHATAAVTGVSNSARASASVLGVRQSISGATSGQATHSGVMNINNSGTLTLTANARGAGGNHVSISASATGFNQHVRNNNGTANFTNSGTVNVSAVATVVNPTTIHVPPTNTYPSLVYAQAIGGAFNAQGSTGVRSVNGHVTTTLKAPASLTLGVSNSGTFNVAAVAVGAGLDHAKALANATGLAAAASSAVNYHRKSVAGANTTFNHFHTHTSTYKYVGKTLSGSLSNSGTINVSATATGGRVNAVGLAVAGSPDNVAITNASGGTLAISAGGATALARGIDVHNVANTYFNYNDSHQVLKNVTLATTKHHVVLETVQRFYTSGYNDVSTQSPTIVTGALTNNGTISVTATGTVSEQADGIAVNASSLTSTLLNGGTVSVVAAGPGAVANGIHVFASNISTTRTHVYQRHTGTDVVGTAAHVDKNVYTTSYTKNRLANVTFSSAINNTGTVTVTSNATGATTGFAAGINLEGGDVTGGNVVNGGTINATANSVTGAANAYGELLIGSTGKLAVNNSKAITASAVTKGAAFAAGIDVIETALSGSTITTSGNITANASGATASADAIRVIGGGAVTVTTTGGTLSSLVTVGSAAAVYGNAINVSSASAAAIALQGGTINGNIVENAAGNTITVSAANTLLNGQINPSKAKIGTLNIATGGTLTLGINSGLGAGTAWVKTFTQTGTLGINATVDPSVSGSIHATSATLGGTAMLNVDPGSAVIPLTNTYRVVFSDNALSGTWSTVSVNDPTFFSAVGVYSANEADITLTRAQLGAISGLTPNEAAVGGALEKIYEAGGGTGPLASLTNALFALTPAQYADALQQLSGETIGDLANADAATLQSFTDAIINHLGDSNDGNTQTASLSGVSGVHPAQLAQGAVNVWGGLVATGGDVDATISGPSYHTHETGLLAGVDTQVAPDVTLGGAIGYTNGTLKTSADRAGYNAFQIFGYGHYEDGADRFYLQGDVGYGSFSNHLTRTISIPGLATGTVSGKFDTSTVQVYGEAGYHLDASDLPINLTPYVAISYLNADADPYTETGTFVAPLAVSASHSESTLSYLGAQFSQTWAMDTSNVTGRLKAAWEHNFTNEAWTVNAAFAPVSAFTYGINGSALSRDAAFIDAGVTVHGSDNYDFMLDYNGRLASDRTENAIVGRLVIKW